MIYLRLFAAFAKVGLLGFGGGLAIVRLIYDSIQPFLDMSRETFANIVAISQIITSALERRGSPELRRPLSESCCRNS